MNFSVATSFLFLASQANAFSSMNVRIDAFSLNGSMNLSQSTELHMSVGDSNTALKSATLSTDVTETDSLLEDPRAKSYLDDGFVFGMEGSGLERPKGKVSQIVVEGDVLETQPYQAALVSATFMSHAAFCVAAISQLNGINHGNAALTALEAVATIVSSWAIADLGSGILHWSVDNYGNGRTPVMGAIISAFQGHHSAPWTITEREFCNNVHKLCIPFGIPTVAAISFLAGPNHPMVSLFFAVFCTLEIMSQEFHKWSHMTPSQLSPVSKFLQKVNFSIGRTPHAMHHIAPYKGNYCIVSGFCNNTLDQSGFFRRLERIIYKMNGVESNAWKIDPKLREKTLAGDYSL